MQVLKAKMAVVFVVVLLMASAMLMAMPIQPVKAQFAKPALAPPAGVTPDATVPSKLYLSFRPNPVGLGQTFLVNMWIAPAPGAGRWFKDFTVTITKPDGTKDTITMDSFVADGTAWFEYIADQAGTWKLKFEFPGTYFPPGNYSLEPGAFGYVAATPWATYTTSSYFKPASTPEQTLVVREEIVLSWPESPLPTDYWTRPVPFEHREWWTILGDVPWRGPGGGSLWDKLYPDTNPYWHDRQYFTPWVQGPNTPHVVWKRWGDVGGLVGAGYPKENYIWPTTGYGMNEPLIIFQGRCYGTNTKVKPVTVNGTTRNIAVSVWECYDLRTGEVYWEQTDVPAPTVIEYGTGALPVPGVIPKFTSALVYLVNIAGGRLVKYSPFTGAVALNVSISPLTVGTYYMNGYALSVQDLGAAVPAALRYRLINWTTLGTTTNFTARIQSNITWPWSTLPATTDFNAGVAATVTNIVVGGAYVGQNITVASLKTGSVLWSITNDEPWYSGSCNVADHGKIAILSARGYYLAYDLYSGKLVWKSETMDYPWDEPGWGTYGVQSAYSMFFRQAYSGVYAFDWKTGKIVWKYEAPAVFSYESEFTGRGGKSVYPFNAPALIADGKMYVYNAEHSPDSPNNRGWATHCINITTGELIWKVMIAGAGWFGAASAELQVADGYLTLGGNDGYMYVFGKGKSATTVTAAPKTVAKGSAVVIEGTVLDMSPAQPGTPCVSKESMALQMEYLHKQMPIRGIYGNETITGVPVTLCAIDSKGNTIDVGTVTTNGYYGTFGMAWTPPEEGTYEIIASFAGDDSYGSSAASTFITVGPAPEPYPQPIQPETPIDNTPLLYGILAAVIIAIIISIVALYAVLKKRP